MVGRRNCTDSISGPLDTAPHALKKALLSILSDSKERFKAGNRSVLIFPN